MDFFDVVNARRSIRAYKDQPVEPMKLHRILESINAAPSAGNLQAFEIYLVEEAAHKAELVRAAREQQFLAEAPIVLVFCTRGSRAVERYGQRGTELYCIQDATIACTFAMLAAAALGLSSVWVGSFDEKQVAEAICAADGDRPVAILPIGYPAEMPDPKPRRGLEELVHRVT